MSRKIAPFARGPYGKVAYDLSLYNEDTAGPVGSAVYEDQAQYVNDTIGSRVLAGFNDLTLSPQAWHVASPILLPSNFTLRGCGGLNHRTKIALMPGASTQLVRTVTPSIGIRGANFAAMIGTVQRSFWNIAFDAPRGATSLIVQSAQSNNVTGEVRTLQPGYYCVADERFAAIQNATNWTVGSSAGTPAEYIAREIVYVESVSGGGTVANLRLQVANWRTRPYPFPEVRGLGRETGPNTAYYALPGDKEASSLDRTTLYPSRLIYLGDVMAQNVGLERIFLQAQDPTSPNNRPVGNVTEFCLVDGLTLKDVHVDWAQNFSMTISGCINVKADGVMNSRTGQTPEMNSGSYGPKLECCRWVKWWNARSYWSRHGTLMQYSCQDVEQLNGSDGGYTAQPLSDRNHGGLRLSHYDNPTGQSVGENGSNGNWSLPNEQVHGVVDHDYLTVGGVTDGVYEGVGADDHNTAIELKSWLHASASGLDTHRVPGFNWPKNILFKNPGGRCRDRYPISATFYTAQQGFEKFPIAENITFLGYTFEQTDRDTRGFTACNAGAATGAHLPGWLFNACGFRTIVTNAAPRATALFSVPNVGSFSVAGQSTDYSVATVEFTLNDCFVEAWQGPPSGFFSAAQVGNPDAIFNVPTGSTLRLRGTITVRGYAGIELLPLTSGGGTLDNQATIVYETIPKV